MNRQSSRRSGALQQPQASIPRTSRRLSAAALLATALAGCGGGEAPTAAAPDAARLRASGPLALAAPALSAPELFDWAPKAYPDYFAGTGLDGTWQGYTYRHFPQTGHYLAVSGGDVFVMGPVTSGRIERIAALGDFTCRVRPDACPAPSLRDTAFAYLNEVRTGGGFGAAAADTRVAAAAQSHADYMTTNLFAGGNPLDAYYQYSSTGVPMAHIETVGTPGFTGVTALDRVQAQGYTSVTSFVTMEVASAVTAATPGAEVDIRQCIAGFLNTVYHRVGVLDNAIHTMGVGVGSRMLAGGTWVRRTCVFNLVRKYVPEPLAADWSGIYPFAGQSGVATTMELEMPDPAPTVPVKGFPVSFQLATGRTLAIGSFTLQDAFGGTVPALLLTRANDARLKANEAYLLPVGALKPGTAYTARFLGTADGTTVSRTWTFTTAS